VTFKVGDAGGITPTAVFALPGDTWPTTSWPGSAPPDRDASGSASDWTWPNTPEGWRYLSARSQVFRDVTGPISTLSVKSIDDPFSPGGRVKVRVRGVTVLPDPQIDGDEPLEGAIVFTDEFDAARGRCGESAFDRHDCAIRGDRLICLESGS
jgi:hypothetical protein